MSATIATRLSASALAFALAMVFAASAAAAPAVNGIFPVKGVGTNNKIAVGPDGNMWVTVSNEENDVARITPDGQVEEFELEGVTGATGIAPDSSGTMWVTYVNGVAKFSVSDPKKTSVATPLAVTAAEAIVAGPDGDMWVGAANLVFHFSPSSPAKLTEFPVLGFSSKDIDVAGSLIAVADSNNFEDEAKVKFGRILTFTTAGVMDTLKTPGGSQGLAGSPVGQIAFSAPLSVPEQSGLITPPNPAQSFELEGDPQGVALGSDQAFWIVQFTPGVLERVTSTGARSSLSGIPPNSSRQIAAGPNNTLWVTLSDAGKEGVARISGLEPPVTNPPVAAPQTKIAKGPKAKVKTTAKRATVKFRFSSTTAGATFECALVKARKHKKGQKAPKPKFKGCKSPKSFSLKPGKYRFWVRAASAGVVDPTPAKRSFRIVHVHKR